MADWLAGADPSWWPRVLEVLQRDYPVTASKAWSTAILENAQRLTPSADLPACRDEDPAYAVILAAAYPDPPEYAHPEESQDADR